MWNNRPSLLCWRRILSNSETIRKVFKTLLIHFRYLYIACYTPQFYFWTLINTAQVQYPLLLHHELTTWSMKLWPCWQVSTNKKIHPVAAKHVIMPQRRLFIILRGKWWLTTIFIYLLFLVGRALPGAGRIPTAWRGRTSIATSTRKTIRLCKF